MREIKFRAWDLRNNKWFHQDLFIMTNAGFYPDFREFDDGQSLWDHEFELMQYTGLTDKNGVEIYEGDILKHSNGEEGLYEVVWHDAGFKKKYTFTRKYQGEKWQESTLLPIHARHFEVCGNIYENPELLEESK